MRSASTYVQRLGLIALIQGATLGTRLKPLPTPLSLARG